MRHSTDKVVVTGGAAFLGSHLVDRLLADTTADIVVFDNLSRGRLTNLVQHLHSPRLSIIQGDVRDAGAVAETLRGADTVYHLAAQSTVAGAFDDPDYSFTTNVVGTYNVLRAATGESVSRVVFASSREVYGEPIELPVEEGQPLLGHQLLRCEQGHGRSLLSRLPTRLRSEHRSFCVWPMHMDHVTLVESFRSGLSRRGQGKISRFWRKAAP